MAVLVDADLLQDLGLLGHDHTRFELVQPHAGTDALPLQARQLIASPRHGRGGLVFEASPRVGALRLQASALLVDLRGEGIAPLLQLDERQNAQSLLAFAQPLGLRPQRINHSVQRRNFVRELAGALPRTEETECGPALGRLCRGWRRCGGRHGRASVVRTAAFGNVIGCRHLATVHRECG